MKHISIFLSILSALFFLSSDVNASERFGLVFDIRGDVMRTSPDGGKIKLDRGSHILMPVTVGDMFESSGQGTVLIVSQKDKKGYEVTPGSKARVDSDGITATEGEVIKKDGMRLPMPGASNNPIGAVVLRAASGGACIKTVSPLNTAVLSLAPVLEWSRSCDGVGSVSVRILHDREVIYETQAQQDTLRLPEGVLKPGGHYRWLVDATPVSGISGGAFTTVTESVRTEYDQLVSGASAGDLPGRLSLLFFLLENNLRTEAALQLKSLQADYPDNEFIKGLAQ